MACAFGKSSYTKSMSQLTQNFRVGALRSVALLAVLGTIARAYIDTEHFRDVIVYYDPARPPIIECYEKNADEHWELIAVSFDSDGDWALDRSMHFTSGNTVKEEEFFPHMKNKQHLYAQADAREAFAKDRTFRCDVIGIERLFQPPLPGKPINAERRQSKAYRALLQKLAKMKLAPRPQPQQDR
jgi:hypothetical protein